MTTINHLVFITLGSRGDLQPLVLLAIHYKRSVSLDTVTIVASEDYQSTYNDSLECHDIHYHPITQASLHTEREKEMIDVWKACQYLQPTKLIYTTFVLEGWSIAEKMNIPSAVISLFPLELYPIPISLEEDLKHEYPHYYGTELWEHITHWIWRLFVSDQGDFRDNVLQLDSIPSNFDHIPPLLYAIDNDLIVTSSTVHVCGFWIDNDMLLQHSTVPYSLTQWMSSVENNGILVIHFGSMDKLSALLSDSSFLTKLMKRIDEILLYYTEVSILWLMSDESTTLYSWVKQYMPVNQLKNRLYIYAGLVDHGNLVNRPNIVGMIHHGGAGTSSTMIYHCIPQAILPFMFDQQFWSQALSKERLGLSLDIHTPWISAVRWMMEEYNHTHAQIWKNRVTHNTTKGIQHAIQLLKPQIKPYC
ncbi:hypothetical protein BDB01DRAFT_852051 [Pilobolus umbonatus]|nr:hypothetical protein BDB01DRAFT_852051 [Pilobolus umbonatus]